MTQGVAWKTILVFSLPIMIGNLLQQLYNTVDGIVVGNYVSETALAAVGSCATLAFVFLAVSIGMSAGCGIFVAQLYGARRMEDLKAAVSTSLILLIGMGIVMSLIGAFGARFLLRDLMGVAEGELLEQAVVYFVIYSVGLVFQYAYNAVAQLLRSIGDSKATLIFLTVAALMNLVLDLVCVISFHWGVAGAAIATVFSQLCSVVVSFYYLFKKYPMLRMTPKELVFDREKCRVILKLAVPATLQQCAVSFGNVFVQRLINSFGQVTMAAYAAGMKVENYIFVPVLGFNIGMSTFTGQNAGAGKMDRIRTAWRSTEVMAVLVTAVFSVLAWVAAAPISALFGIQGDTLAQSVELIRFQSFFFVLFGAYMVASGVLQGAGDVLFASMATLSSLATRVIVAYAMAYVFHMGHSSCWKAVPIGWAVGFAMALTRYFAGTWKRKIVVKAKD